jgi:hypothetical protein
VGLHLEQRGGVGEVVGAGQAVVERGPGRHDTAAATDLDALVVVVGIEPERAHRARVGVQRAGDQTHDGGLARAIRPEQHGDGAARDLEGQIVDRDHVAEGASDARERDSRAGVRSHPVVTAREVNG